MNDKGSPYSLKQTSQSTAQFAIVLPRGLSESSRVGFAAGFPPAFFASTVAIALFFLDRRRKRREDSGPQHRAWYNGGWARFTPGAASRGVVVPEEYSIHREATVALMGRSIFRVTRNNTSRTVPLRPNPRHADPDDSVIQPPAAMPNPRPSQLASMDPVASQ